jgi:hypothetical protein
MGFNLGSGRLTPYFCHALYAKRWWSDRSDMNAERKTGTVTISGGSCCAAVSVLRRYPNPILPRVSTAAMRVRLVIAISCSRKAERESWATTCTCIAEDGNVHLVGTRSRVTSTLDFGLMPVAASMCKRS